MRDCPRCSRPVDGTNCGFCGYGEAAAKATDPLRHVCQFVDRGQRCAEAGGISPNPRGGDGPWYCRAHYDLVTGRGDTKGACAPPVGFQHLKDLVARRRQGLKEAA